MRVTKIHVELSNEWLASLSLSQYAAVNPTQERRRIGILGGTFNPPHLGHLMMADQVGSQLELDEVWFMPTAKPPHKPGDQVIAVHHRLQMLALAIGDHPKFKIQDYEARMGGKNYTIDTMRYFLEAYPETDFYFIIGGDSANDLSTWKGIGDLINLVQLVAVARPGEAPYEGIYPIIWVDAPMVDLSSTEIRLRVYLDQSIRYQVPEAVRHYIIKHQLYQADGGLI